MKTYWYTIENSDAWRIADTEIVIIAENRTEAKKLLKKNYGNLLADLGSKKSSLVELKPGVHLIQESVTE